MINLRFVVSVASIGVLFCSIDVRAGEINPDAPAPSWRLAKGPERIDYATMASIMCQSSNCGPGQLKACMDEVTKPPLPPGLNSMSIGQMAINCIKILKAQQ